MNDGSIIRERHGTGSGTAHNTTNGRDKNKINDTHEQCWYTIWDAKVVVVIGGGISSVSLKYYI